MLPDEPPALRDAPSPGGFLGLDRLLLNRSNAQKTRATTKVTASSTATEAPPSQKNSPAPARGAVSFMLSPAAIRSPLTSPSRSFGIAAGRIELSAESLTTKLMPYSSMTA